jgi:hypothetical protein
MIFGRIGLGFPFQLPLHLFDDISLETGFLYIRSKSRAASFPKTGKIASIEGIKNYECQSD